MSNLANQTIISTLVTYILFLKSTDQISNLVSNRYIAQFVEDIINFIKISKKWDNLHNFVDFLM